MLLCFYFLMSFFLNLFVDILHIIKCYVIFTSKPPTFCIFKTNNWEFEFDETPNKCNNSPICNLQIVVSPRIWNE